MAETFTVERGTRIGAAPATVYEHLVDFHRWPAWSPWEGLDPAMERIYAGPDRGLGATYAWTGNRKAGAGSMEITEAVDAERVTIALEFLKPFRSSNTTVFRLHPDGDGTEIIWTMSGPMSFATRLFSLIRSMDRMIGPDFEKGLAQLRTVAEQQD